MHRPTYLRAGAWAAVGVGGAAGTLARFGTDRLAGPAEVPWSTFAVNIVGAFLLGLLLEVYAARRPSRRGDRLRLLLGTGFLGGFTTYSTFARQVGVLLHGGALAGLGYAAAMVLTGLGAAALGVKLAEVLLRRRPS
ncbi:CrcB family protein [Georgenia ruanii]|uniref:Fluoride-specific ion channel FluC n=1 Tax=Georgenia ruanii TaxID=348442 RepID=A0A7J9UW73_9MICO|nr:CrcB family protein [Georgenia ruanii]